MVLAYLRHASNSLWPALVAHGVFNIAMTVAIYAALA
jgi:membrane protease YdiL (CAAX protease family)